MEANGSRGNGEDRDDPIAIIGMAFEFPQGATSVESFWQMISEGRSASTEFPSDRLNIDAFYHPDENRPSSVRSSRTVERTKWQY
jgi:acyl transferase domain-containing protein